MALLACLPTGQLMAEAVQSERLQQTIENPGDVAFEERQELLDLAPLQQNIPLLLYGGRVSPTAAKEVLAAADIIQFFSIFDAKTELAGDLDHDGFYYQLRVTFDADVDIGGANVYAMLYLSYEGGPWNHFFTTDVFAIVEDSFYDDYEVVTQLLEGYPTGYYDVLIELYDADWDVLVATYDPYDDVALQAIPLEDQQRDYPDDDGGGGGGGIGWLGLLLLGAWWGVGCRNGSSGPKRPGYGECDELNRTSLAPHGRE
jgi:hypothetical protein